MANPPVRYVPPDSSLLLYTEWLESMKLVASSSSGNILSFDGSMEGFEKTMKQMTMLGRSKTTNGVDHAEQH